MARRPTVLSAHPSAWTTDAEQGTVGELVNDTASCQFCGQPTAGWQKAFHLNDDHADNTPDNLAVACPLCHLPQHLGRPEIDREARLIWLPEMKQGTLMVLIRHIHLACVETRLPAGYGALASMRTSALGASAAYHAYRTLFDRAAVAEIRLGTASPRLLGAALRGMPAADYARRSALLAGIRLLPIGRLFRDGQDIYPNILRDWTAASRAVAPVSAVRITP